MSEPSQEEYLSEVKRVADRISAMLSDPHPGLSTWCEMYARNMQYISDLWTKGSEAMRIRQ
jgi:hypothetical protein